MAGGAGPVKEERPSRLAALLAGAAALLPLSALGLATASPLQASTRSPFAPPAQHLLLIRTLHSPLADGREIVSQRTYEVTIRRNGSGWLVDGKTVACQVDAPEALHTLAELERNRSESGLFPLLLDAQGMIVSSPREPAPLPGAAAMVGGYSPAAHAPPAQQATAREVVRSLLVRRVNTPWPADLFSPSPGHRSDVQQVALPDGSQGSVTVEGLVRLGGTAGLVSTTERLVTTRLGERSRTTREEWTVRLAE